MNESQLSELRRRMEARSEASADNARDLVRDASRDPLMEGVVAGCKYGALMTVLGAVAVRFLSKQFPLWKHVSPAGNAWLVIATGMSGFFVASEKAVLSPSRRAAPGVAPVLDR